MVTVWVLLDPRGEPAGVRAQGHAGWGSMGTDVVCAGISSLLLTTMLGLTGELRIPLEGCRTDNGELTWTLPEGLSAVRSRGARLLVNTMLLGLREIQKRYPGTLRIRRRVAGHAPPGRGSRRTARRPRES